MGTYFYRSEIICEVLPHPDGWRWVAFLGVNRSNPAYGKRFIPRTTGPCLHHVPHKVGSDLIDAPGMTWWLSFEGTRAAEWPTVVELQLASDELNNVASVEELESSG